ncbi:putative COPII coat assembly protein SEC16 [Hibiscus syriacus]|uniref:COPII coat assembly protein SEC16 n=1 Tax=Hibiscus syriacus TaxID=106335 RepID=A0A6A3AA69_HIBSY|nr:putative COPII coat assembly protein SEC16 [Hibiscus syriacus]
MLRPYMARHGTEVDKKVQEVRARAWDFALYYWQNCTELGQSKFLELLQYLAGQSSSFKHGKQKNDEQKPNIPPLSGKSKKSSAVESPNSKCFQF